MHTDQSHAWYLGIQFSSLHMDPLVEELKALSASDRFSFVVTPNVDHVVRLYEGDDHDIKAAFMAAYRSAHLRVCDSRILQLLAKWRGVELVVVPGSDLTAQLFDGGHLDGRSVALVGGEENTVELLQEKYPYVSLIQFRPPMGLLRNKAAQDEVIAFVKESKCDFTFFAVGAPQSEIIADLCCKESEARGVGLCVGASVEFITGIKRRAPEWMQRARLEWAFRLLSEPRRLWRRYLLMGPKIISISKLEMKE